MTRSPLLAAGAAWVVAIVVLIGLAASGTVHEVLHVYLVAWLILISLPLGALPVVMGLEATAAPEPAEAPILRLMLAGMPLLALLIVPVLIGFDSIYAWAPGSPLVAAGHYAGFGAQWFSRVGFSIRAIVYLVVWTALALAFLRPRAPRRGLPIFGLLVHLVIGTLAAFDWFMSLDAGFTSASYGVLVISTQAAFAWTTAMTVSLAVTGQQPGRPGVAALFALVIGAAFVQFSQYLVIWSANLPKEIVWYQTRGQGPAGPIFAICGPLLAASGLVLTATLRRSRFGTLVGLAALLVAEILDLVCLASPRGTFTVVGVVADVAMTVAVGGILAFGTILVGSRRHLEVRHG